MKTKNVWALVALIAVSFVFTACEQSRCGQGGGYGYRGGYGGGRRMVAPQSLHVRFHVSGPYDQGEIAQVVEAAKAQGVPPEVVRQRILSALPDAQVEIIPSDDGPLEGRATYRGREVGRRASFEGQNCPPGIDSRSVLGGYREHPGVRARMSPSGNLSFESDPQTYADNVGGGLYINVPRGRPVPFGADWR